MYLKNGGMDIMGICLGERTISGLVYGIGGQRRMGLFGLFFFQLLVAADI